MQLNSKRSCVRCKQFWVCQGRIFAKDDGSTLYFTMKARKMQGGMIFCCAEIMCCAPRGNFLLSVSVQRRSAGPEAGRGAASAAPLHDPSRENGIAERPQALRYPETINNFSLNYAQSERGAHCKSSPLTTQSPTWKSSAAGCAAATERASDCDAPRGAMRGWRCTGAPDTPCPACASSGSGRHPPHT